MWICGHRESCGIHLMQSVRQIFYLTLIISVVLLIETPKLPSSAKPKTNTNLPKLSSLHTMGFTKQTLKAGNGVKPQRGQSVTVHCTGFGKNRDLSQKFWSTKDPGQEPFTFKVGMGNGKSENSKTNNVHGLGSFALNFDIYFV